MALGDLYASLGDIKSYLKISSTDTARDVSLGNALASASKEVERWTGRQFNQASSATARVYKPTTWHDCSVDDFWTLSGLVVSVDPGGTGSYSQTFDSTQYELYPLNGLRDGTPWPYTDLLATGGMYFPRVQYRRRATVQVTAQWGWPSVPAPVKQAVLIMAAQEFRMGDAPWGVAGMSESGSAIRIAAIPKVKELLTDYSLNTIQAR